MAIYERDILIEQGTDTVVNVFFANKDPAGSGDPAKMVYLNFTGYALRGKIRYAQDRNSAVLQDLTSMLSFTHGAFSGGPPDPGAGAPNGIQLWIPKASSLTYTPGTYYFDIFADAPGGNPDGSSQTEAWIAGKAPVISRLT